MAKDEKNKEKEEVMEEELDLEDLDQVSGGALRNTRKTNTTDISQDTINRI